MAQTKRKKYVVTADVCVIAKNAKEAHKLVSEQLNLTNGDGSHWYDDTVVEAHSKHTKTLRCKTVKFYEGDLK